MCSWTFLLQLFMYLVLLLLWLRVYSTLFSINYTENGNLRRWTVLRVQVYWVRKKFDSLPFFYHPSKYLCKLIICMIEFESIFIVCVACCFWRHIRLLYDNIHVRFADLWPYEEVKLHWCRWHYVIISYLLIE